MAEKITLVDISFDVAGANEGLQKLQEESAKLAQRQAELKKAQAEVNASMKEAQTAFNAGAISQEEYNKAVEESAKAQAALKVETISNNKSIAENTQAIKANVTTTKAQIDSIEQMRSKLATVSQEWAKMSGAERENTARGKELSAQKRQLTDDLKRLEAATGDTRRNVGNYTDSILQAANSTKAAAGGVSGLANGMAGSIVGIKAFNASLAANPVLAIASAVMLLIGWVEKLGTKSSEGGNKMSQAFAPVKVLFERITDTVGFFFSAFFTGIGKVIELAMKAAHAIGLVSDATMQAADEAARLAKEQRDIYNQETKQLVQLEKLKLAQEEQKAILADQTKSAAERKAAGEEALRLMKQEEELTVGLLKRKYEQIKANNALADSTDEDLRKEQEALRDVIAAQAQAAAKRKEIYGQVTGFEKSLRDKATAESKAANDARAKSYEESKKRKADAAEKLYQKEIQRLNDIIAAELLSQRKRRAEGEINSEEEQVMFETLQSKKLDALSKQYEEGKITQEAYNIASQELEVERLERIAEINQQARDKEKEVALMEMQAKQELAELDIESDFERQLFRLDMQYNAEIEAAEAIGAETSSIEKKYAKIREKIAKEEANAKLAIAGDLAGQLAGVLGEGTVAGKVAAVTQATINTYLGATKALAQGGFFGIAQAAIVISTGLAQVAKIVSTKVEKPEINKPSARYEKGGKMALFGGRRHSEGGTILRGSDGSVLEVEKGESAFVLNRSATSAISALSELNMKHGGNSFSQTGLRFFANGGQIQLSGGVSSGLSDKDLDRMANVIAFAVSNLPNPIVTVSDISNMQAKTEKISQISVL